MFARLTKRSKLLARPFSTTLEFDFPYQFLNRDELLLPNRNLKNLDKLQGSGGLDHLAIFKFQYLTLLELICENEHSELHRICETNLHQKLVAGLHQLNRDFKLLKIENLDRR